MEIRSVRGMKYSFYKWLAGVASVVAVLPSSDTPSRRYGGMNAFLVQNVCIPGIPLFVVCTPQKKMVWIVALLRALHCDVPHKSTRT